MASTETLEKPIEQPAEEQLWQQHEFWDPDDIAGKTKQWKEDMVSRATERYEAFLADPTAKRSRLLTTESNLHDQVLGANIDVKERLIKQLAEGAREFTVDHRSRRESGESIPYEFYITAVDLGGGLYLRDTLKIAKARSSRLTGDTYKYDTVVELVRAGSIEELKDIDLDNLVGDEPSDNPPVKPESEISSWQALKRGAHILKSFNTLLSFEDPELGKASFVGAELRCLGHCAAGTITEIPEGNETIPPVNPWKVVKGLAKAVVSKEQRREVIKAMGENMTMSDLIGLVAMLDILWQAEGNGMPTEQAKELSWDMYESLLEAGEKNRVRNSQKAA